MGGGSRQTTSTEYTPEQRRLQSLQAESAAAIAPGLTEFVTSILSGDPSRASGYASSMIAPNQSATSRAIEGILARTPRGGLQTQLVEQAKMQGAFRQADVTERYIQEALRLAGALFGYNPPAQGQTTRQSSGGPSVGLALGPLSIGF